MKIKKQCKKCGKDFSLSPSRANRPFCSRACFYSFKYGNTENKSSCCFCGAEISVSNWSIKNRKKFFCSTKCRIAHQVKSIWVSCDGCGCFFKKTLGQLKYSRLNFCSAECSQSFHSGKNHPLFIDGKIRVYGLDWKSISEFVRERDGRVCRKCGKPEPSNGKKLDVHHIKPIRLFSEIQKANHPDNLISLCASCHRKCFPR